MIRKSFLFLCLLGTASALTSFTFEKKQKALKTIVIDAGHGIMPNGGYNGARGSYSYEDQICLAVSKKLIALVAREYPEVRIIETRPNKNLVGLRERADMANQNKGELFISIHVNAAPPRQHRKLTGYKTVTSYVGKGKKRRKVTRKVPQYRTYTTPNPAKGTETYIWGAHKNEDKEVAMRENAPMLTEENYKNKYGDIDPNSPEFIALSLLKTKQFFKRSATLAGMVEDQFVKVGRTSRGEAQRSVGIWVLQATAMPSILVETGYITNRAEEDYLNSESGQQEIARCITNALGDYIKWLEKNQVGGNAGRLPQQSSDAAYQFLEAVEQNEHRRMQVR